MSDLYIGALEERCDALEQRIDELTSYFESRFERLCDQINRQGADVSHLGNKVRYAESHIDRAENEVADISRRIDHSEMGL